MRLAVALAVTAWTLAAAAVGPKRATAYIEGQIVELDVKHGCTAIVNKGASHGVRVGSKATVLEHGAPVDSGSVEKAYPALAQVKLTPGRGCRFAVGTTVRIDPAQK